MHRDEVFIRHGLEIPEKMNYTRGSIFPPPATIMDIKKMMLLEGRRLGDFTVDGMYAIEIDHYPFGIPGNRLISHCSNHDYNGRISKQPTTFGKVKGYIAQSDFARKNGRVHHLETRDHLYATSELACEDWIYLYTNIDDDDKQLRSIQSNGLLVIPQKMAIAQHNLASLIFNRLRILTTS